MSGQVIFITIPLLLQLIFSWMTVDFLITGRVTATCVACAGRRLERMRCATLLLDCNTGTLAMYF